MSYYTPMEELLIRALTATTACQEALDDLAEHIDELNQLKGEAYL